MDYLLKKIVDGSAYVGVIGLGYVGLPLAVEFSKAGFNVTGIDVDIERVNNINKGINYIGDVNNDEFSQVVNIKKLRATSDFSTISQLDAISICVPTPLRKTKDPDMSYIIGVTKEIKNYLRKGQLIVLESTTYPGTTDEVILPELESKGLKVGVDFYLVFSPERVDPGNKNYNIKNTPKVIGGVTNKCTEIASALYKKIVNEVIIVRSTKSAEMVKLLENTFRMVNIGLVNEVAIMCDKLNIDVWEVIEAASTKPFGFIPFYPGPGLGGHCIPIDPHYLSWKLKTLNYNARFIELAGEINTYMPQYVVNKITDILNNESKSVKGANILILGITYKKDVADIRESPAIDIIKLLELKGANVRYNDPYFPSFKGDGDILYSLKLSKEVLRDSDCIAILADHSSYDWEWIINNSKVILDTRNAIRGKSDKKVIKL